MAKDVNPPRGMRDFLPAEKAKRDRVLGVIRETYKSHGYQEIETPALEDLSRLTSGQGGDNEKLAYRVMKRGEELERALADTSEKDNLSDLGLRFDLTVPLTRYYATNAAKLPRVFKAIQTGPVWRAERSQKGRYRQFVQCDIDIIGDETFLAEVELLVAVISCLKDLKITDFKIRINHRVLLDEFLSSYEFSEIDKAQALVILDKFDKLGVEGVKEELAQKFASLRNLSDLLSRVDLMAINPQLAFEGLSSRKMVQGEYLQIKHAVESLSGNDSILEFDPTLIRGMGYYTGFIFEIDQTNSSGSLGGGGRYDNMVGRWLNKSVPAVGFSIGFERLMDIAKAEEIRRPQSVVLLLDSSSPACLAAALKKQQELLQNGRIVRLERAPKRTIQLLDSLKAEGFETWARVTDVGECTELKAIE